MSKKRLSLLRLAIFRIFSALYYIITSTSQRFFRRISDLKSKYWWLIGGLIVAAISFAICEGGKYYYNTRIRDQIVVHPDKINLITKNLDVTKVFEIKNRSTDRAFFSIWLKLSGKDTRSDLNKIEITTEEGEVFVSGNVGEISINWDIIKLQGLDERRKPCIFLVLYSLKNDETKLFKVKKHHSVLNEKETIDLTLEVKGFSGSPSEITSENNQTGLAIRPPESFELQSFAILVKKNL